MGHSLMIAPSGCDPRPAVTLLTQVGIRSDNVRSRRRAIGSADARTWLHCVPSRKLQIDARWNDSRCPVEPVILDARHNPLHRRTRRPELVFKPRLVRCVRHRVVDKNAE